MTVAWASEVPFVHRPAERRSVYAMSMNELILIGTGFVLARVVYLFYFAPKRSAEADRG
jgi:hypothetical protein